MRKPRIALFDFACCEGCQLQLVNMEEEILDLLSVVDPVEWREAMSEQSTVYDIAIVEGSITRPEDEGRLAQIRERAAILIALGACATIGGVNRLKNQFEMGEVRRAVYGGAGELPHLDTYPVKAIDEVVKVDYKIHGCPIDAAELAYVIRSLLAGVEPKIPDYPVCVECKLREVCCRYEFGEVCLGPLTRAGCGARCPANGMWCFGCRGFVDKPNIEAATQVMERHGKSFEDLRSRMQLFGSHRELKP